MEKKNCFDCVFCPSEFLKGKRDTFVCEKNGRKIKYEEHDSGDDIKGADGCKEFKQAKYVLTEKAILGMALSKFHVIGEHDWISNEESDDFKNLETAWDLFFNRIVDAGYYVPTNSEKKTSLVKRVKEVFVKKPTMREIMTTVLKVVFGVTDKDICDAVFDMFVEGLKKAEYV